MQYIALMLASRPWLHQIGQFLLIMTLENFFHISLFLIQTFMTNQVTWAGTKYDTNSIF